MKNNGEVLAYYALVGEGGFGVRLSAVVPPWLNRRYLMPLPVPGADFGTGLEMIAVGRDTKAIFVLTNPTTSYHVSSFRFVPRVVFR